MKARRYTHSTGSPGRNNASGQAMIEFIVGLIAVLALAAGLLQLATLTRAHSDAMVKARAEAGELAMMDANLISNAEFIRDWREGSDKRRHTRDDQTTAGDVRGFDNNIVAHAAPDQAAWTILDTVPADALPALHGEPDPASRFGLVHGHASDNVALISAVQSYLYRADHIDVVADVWMTSTRGLY